MDKKFRMFEEKPTSLFRECKVIAKTISTNHAVVVYWCCSSPVPEQPLDSEQEDETAADALDHTIAVAKELLHR